MNGFLLDTNVLSELRKPRADPSVAAFVSAQPEESLFVSDVTIAEIRFGIEQAPDAERRAVVSDWLAHTLRPLFAGRTLPLTEDVILRWRSWRPAAAAGIISDSSTCSSQPRPPLRI